MIEQKTENAAPTAMGNGAKSICEALKPQAIHTRNVGFEAIYFWNPSSQSVEPLRIRWGVLA